MRIFFFIFFFPIGLPPAAQPAPVPTERSFDEIFPGLPLAVRAEAFSGEGYLRSSQRADPSILASSSRSAIDPQIINAVLQKQPGYLVESILVIPGRPGEYSLLKVYNALGKIRGLRGRLYHSHTRDETVPLFEEVTRIESARRNNPIEDPPPAARIPNSETIYMRFKDINFGNTYYRGEMALARRGLRYSLSNFRNMTYFFVPVIKEEMFNVQLYFEPISEGILIYTLAGADVSDLIATRADMASAISKRLAVIIGWVAEGIKGT
ncbi:MAG: hypothetical protein LBI06_02505 [Treponema sp.]|nr:hypothetical protein [Treponema sp.]